MDLPADAEDAETNFLVAEFAQNKKQKQSTLQRSARRAAPRAPVRSGEQLAEQIAWRTSHPMQSRKTWKKNIDASCCQQPDSTYDLQSL